MAGRNFDISRYASSLQTAARSESDTMQEIPLGDIRDNPRNFYPAPTPEALTELACSIQANGLLEPPTVVPGGDGRTYRLISGHSRVAALRHLAWAHPDPAWATVLCRVLPEMSEDAELSAVIEANRQRVKSPALLAEEAERLTQAYLKRKEAGEALPGRIRDRVAQTLQVNATKLANLSVIRRGLHNPELAARWERQEIPEAAALEIARMDDAQQDSLEQHLRETGAACTIREVKRFAAGETADKAEPVKAPEPEETPAEPAEEADQLVICGWMPGSTTPAEPGEFAVLIWMQTRWYHTFFAWDGETWRMINSYAPAAMTPDAWMRLPPTPAPPRGE